MKKAQDGSAPGPSGRSDPGFWREVEEVFSAVLDAARETVRPLALKRQIVLESELPPGLPSVEVDPVRITAGKISRWRRRMVGTVWREVQCGIFGAAAVVGFGERLERAGAPL